jgi:DNA-directed RNA polymerase subunit RPC12/RpoP
VSEAKEFCTRCQTVTASRTVHHASGTEFLCVECGAQVDFLHNEEWGNSEPFGTCQSCGGNLYVGDDIDYCEGCEPYIYDRQIDDDNGWIILD